jgi:ADP-ribose pyrophosphatase YjhB (NUDIX family)
MGARGTLAMAEERFFFGAHAAIVERGRILILRRAPEMSYRPGAWDLPGGHLALGESVEECLLREVAEETGLEIEIDRILGLNKAIAEPYIQALYSCRVRGAPAPIRLRPHEHTDARWIARTDFASLGELIPYLDAILRRGLLDFLR